MKDLFGIEITIGDLVIPTKDSSFAGYFTEPYVVTRLGSDDKVQLNGIEYGKADKLVIFNAQYQSNHPEGYQGVIDLRCKYAKFFNDTPVQKKESPSRFLITKLNGHNYPQSPIIKYVLVEVKGNNLVEHYESINAVLSTYTGVLGDYFKKESLKKNGRFGYSEINDSISRKKMQELGLQDYINQEIPESVILEVVKMMNQEFVLKASGVKV